MLMLAYLNKIESFSVSHAPKQNVSEKNADEPRSYYFENLLLGT